VIGSIDLFVCFASKKFGMHRIPKYASTRLTSVPVLLYGCETWSTTKLQCSRIDAFEMRALRKILRIPYTRHVMNVEVRATTGCHPLSQVVTDRRLRLFGHIARS